MKTIQAQIVIAGDLQARRISAAENLQREDLSAIETIEDIVEIVDAELMEDIQYLSMGKTPADRVKTLLGKLDSVRRSKELGYEVGTQARLTSHKFVGSVEKIFKNLPKPLEWRLFYSNGLPLLIHFCEEAQKVSTQLNLTQLGLDPECKWTEEALAQRLGVIEQTINSWISDIRARQKASRNTVILRLSRLGWPQEKISETVGLSQNRVSEIIGNTNFGNIDTFLSQGHDMEYIARHYHMDLAMA